MIRKLFIAAVLCASAVFAQDDYSYQSSTAESTQSNVSTQSSTNSSEPLWNVSIHPVSLVVMTALNIPTVYVTIERVLGQNTSFIGRPFFIYTDSDALGVDDDDVDFSLLALGASVGARYYFNPTHKGLYIDALLEYAFVDIEYDDDYESASVIGNAFGPYILFGWKFATGNTTFSIDLGIGYNFAFASATGSSADEDDIESISATGKGLGTELNLTFGLQF